MAQRRWHKVVLLSYEFSYEKCSKMSPKLLELCLVGQKNSMPNMTGRPGYRTMEMNGGSSAPYLARTPCVPLFSTLFKKGGNRRAFRLPGAGGDHFHCTVEPSPGRIRCLSGPVLRDTARLSQRYPPIARYGVLVSQHGQLGAIPPPPFSEHFPPGRACEVEVRYPPSKGVSQRYLRDTLSKQGNGCDTPLCDTISKRYCAIWGGISHWAAKFGAENRAHA